MMWRTIILLFLALPLSGQQGMLLVGGGEVELGDLLLDSFPGAVAAYSLRLIDSDYPGNCIRVSRLSDSAESDIGFLASGALDTNSINTFCSGTTCNVIAWYDQSGEGNDLGVSVLTGVNTPAIYGSGQVFRKNGFACINFSNDWLTTSALGTLHADSVSSHFSVSYQTTTGLGTVFTTDGDSPDAGGVSDRLVIYHDTRITPNRNFFINTGSNYTADLSTARTGSDLLLLSSFRDASKNMSAFDNSATGGTDTYIGTYDNTDFTLGRSSQGNIRIEGGILEVLVYRGNQSANRTAIETNINNYYSIY